MKKVCSGSVRERLLLTRPRPRWDANELGRLERSSFTTIVAAIWCFVQSSLEIEV